jgi:hypothetical protein
VFSVLQIFLIKAVGGFFSFSIGKVTTSIEKNPDKEPPANMFLQRWGLNSVRLHGKLLSRSKAFFEGWGNFFVLSAEL